MKKFRSARHYEILTHKLTYVMLRSESLSSICAKLHTVAASNNRDNQTRSLLSSPLATTINCLSGSQALFTDHSRRSLYQDRSIIVCSRHLYMDVILRTHPIHGQSHIQRNANQEIETVT